MSKFEVVEIGKEEKAKEDINRTFQTFDEPGFFFSSPVRRSSGFIFIENGMIAKLSRGLVNTLGLVKGVLFRDLFADSAVYPIKRDQLERLGKTEVRLKDAQGSVFWARLSCKDDGVYLEDIDMEKNFELDCEDLIEEQERSMNVSGLFPAYQ